MLTKIILKYFLKYFVTAFFSVYSYNCGRRKWYRHEHNSEQDEEGEVVSGRIFWE